MTSPEKAPRRQKPKPPRGQLRPSWLRLGQHAATTLCCTALLAMIIPQPASADFKVRSPSVDDREVEIENNFSTSFDKRSASDGRTSATQEIGIAVVPFWQVELEGEFGKEPHENWQFNATTLENTFMLTEPGKYWMDFGIFAEYSRAQDRNNPDTVKFGGLFQKEQGKLVHTLNLYLEKEVGSKAGTADDLQYAWQTRYRVNALFQPGIELYGEIADLSNAGKFGDTQFRVGPVIAGNLGLGEVLGRGKLKYEVGYLFGTTSETERGTLRTRLELEIPY